MESVTQDTVPLIEINGNVYPLPEKSGEISVETGTVMPTEAETTQVNDATEVTSEKITEDVTVSDPVSVAVKNYETYEVKKGETLITISKKFYGGTEMIDSIMALNGIKNRDYIYEGQIIKLP